MSPRSFDLSRRSLLAGLLAGAAGPVWAEALAASPVPHRRPGATKAAVSPRTVSSKPAQALIEAASLGGVVGFVVADAATGLVLESVNATLGLPPASVAKTMTALYALDALGPSYRFATRLIATGPVQAGQIAGDLILAGSGDPTLSTDHLAAMAQALKAAGVRGIGGRFLVWDGALPSIPQIDAGQPEHVGYNPAVSGLNLNFNRVYFEWRRSGQDYAISMDARSDLYRPRVRMATMQVVDRAAPLYTYASAGGTDQWTVARAALGAEGSRWLPVRRPALYAGEAFQWLAAAQGTTLPAPQLRQSAPQGTTLVQHVSDDLTGILRDMLRFSTNMTAEVLGLTASAAHGARGATLTASAGRMSTWAGQTFGLKTARFVDHSGLGGATRIAPADMVRALVRAAPGSPLRGILRSSGLRDANGNEITDHPVRIAAKTGTLNFVSGLAGYATTANGTDLAFAIFAADAARRDRVPMAEREQPEGGQAWAKRARRLQQGLIARWANVYGA